MNFHEVRLPETLSYGSRGGPGFKTTLIELKSGQLHAVSHLSQMRHSFDIAKSVIQTGSAATLKRFYAARRGPANGFRFKDHFDYLSTDHGSLIGEGASAISDQDVLLGEGDGVTTEFQLIKTYDDAAGTITRKITKPVTGTTVVSLNGVSQSSGFSVTTSTGVVRFSSAPGSGVLVRAGFEFDVPVHFGKEIDDVFDVSVDEWDSNSITIPLVEILDPIGVNEEFLYRGASSLAVAADLNLTHAHGFTVSVTPTTSGLKIYLPAKAAMPLGGPHWSLVNLSGSNAIDIYDVDTDTLLKTLTVSGGATPSYEINLGVDASSARTWYLF